MSPGDRVQRRKKLFYLLKPAVFKIFNQSQKVLAVLVFVHRLGNFTHTFRGNPPLAEGDSLKAGNLQALTFFNDLNES